MGVKPYKFIGEPTHLVDDGNFLLLAQVLIHHVHFGRTDHRFSEGNDGF